MVAAAAIAAASFAGCGGGEQGASPGASSGGPSSSSSSGNPGSPDASSPDSAGLPGPSSVCGALAPSAGTVIHVTPAQAAQLPTLVADAPVGSVIVLADGTYPVTAGLYFKTANVTLRSASDDASKVIIDGLNGYSGSGTDTRVPELVNISASNVTIAHVTVTNARDHLVHIVPGAASPTNQVKLYAIVATDPGEQAVKINPNGSGNYTDDGEISCSRIELTAKARPWVESAHADGCYTGGIDAHQARGWKIKNNTIKGFWCPTGLSEHGIHLWSGSRDTVVESNRIVDCARGIGFGLIDHGTGRSYPDNPCGGEQNMGHYGGEIRNNTIFANDPGLFASGAKFDSGISVADACAVKVQHNTVASTGYAFAGIEYRFARTTADVVQNLSTHRILARDGATATLTTNVEDLSSGELAGTFVSVTGDGDLHLQPTASRALDRGAPVAGVTKDIDGAPRDLTPDLGADELSTYE